MTIKTVPVLDTDVPVPDTCPPSKLVRYLKIKHRLFRFKTVYSTNKTKKYMSESLLKLKDYKEKFEKDFINYFENLEADLKYPRGSFYVPFCLSLIRDLSLRGGKRQRVAFLYETYKLFKSEVIEELIDCAVSIELLQTHLLIHDDLIDNSPTRRGGPATYYQMRNHLAEKQKNEAPALGFTIQTGDLAAYLAIDAVNKSAIDRSKKEKVIRVQIEAGRDTFIGQIFDLERDLLENISEDALIELANYKAGRSSVAAPMFIGMIMADSDSSENIKRISNYATNIAIALQLQDDYLGVFGNPNITGKSNISDIVDGKKTILIEHTVANSTKREKHLLNLILGNPKATKEEILYVKQLIKDKGSDVYLKTLARRFGNKALEEARRWKDLDVEAVEFFIQAAKWSFNRNL